MQHRIVRKCYTVHEYAVVARTRVDSSAASFVRRHSLATTSAASRTPLLTLAAAIAGLRIGVLFRFVAGIVSRRHGNSTATASARCPPRRTS